MTWRKSDPENGSLQCGLVFGVYHNFASDNNFACGPTETIYAWVMHK